MERKNHFFGKATGRYFSLKNSFAARSREVLISSPPLLLSLLSRHESFSLLVAKVHFIFRSVPAFGILNCMW